MNNIIKKEELEALRIKYKKGSRIELVSMNDPYTKIPPGTKGTVVNVDDIGTVHSVFDSGHSIGAVYGVDTIKLAEEDKS